jgi:beta-glucosidase
MKCNKELRLSYTEKAKNIVEQMTLEEKVRLMSGTVSLKDMIDDFKTPGRHYNWYPYPSGGNDRLSVPQMKFCDGPRGVVCGSSTCFPVTMLRGATFDIDLEKRIGEAIGKEIRAHGGNLFGGVCINLPYNPGWGRSQEVYGEESFHLGAMGSALVKGVQEQNVIACVKHYAFNSMEISRFKVSVDCDKRTEQEVYLPHFKDCIDAGAASVMSSYNLYKGTHCGHSNYLLNDILKKEWDFDGFVMSDFVWGVRDTVEAANGGQDMEMCCTEFFGDKLVTAVEEGKVPEENINRSAIRIVRTLLAFAEADDKIYDKSIIGCKEHINLALEAAEKGITLIKNNNNTLPLKREKDVRIAVIGKLGEKGDIGDYGSSRVFPSHIVTPVEGIANIAPNNEVIYYNGEDIEHAKDIARTADAVVFVVGYNHSDEGEYVSDDQIDGAMSGTGGDRVHSLGLHEDEINLLQEVGPVNKKSVAVLIGGNMIMIDEWKEAVSAIIMAYYPGMEGGTALAEILFGDVNPSGKLPFVIPQKESDLPQVNWDATTQWYDYYHGYAKLEKEGVKPSVPYGYGMSYTTFKISNASFKVEGKELIASCEVTNTGKLLGDEIVQLYVGFKNSKVNRPVKLLRGFKRVSLNVNETKTVTIKCPLDKLCWFNSESNQWELEKMTYEAYIGSSSDRNDLLEGTFSI